MTLIGYPLIFLKLNSTFVAVINATRSDMIILKRILIWLRNLILFLFVSSLVWVVACKFIPVYYTP